MIKKAMLFIASTILVLLLCEGILQLVDYPARNFSPWISDKTTGFRSAPNIRQRMITTEFDVEIRTNEYGFRDDAIGKKNGFRILVLGDSFTFGYGVERNFLFADLLEHKLQEEIINAGVGGFEIIHQLKWFRTAGKSFDADLVIYALYLGNDLSRNSDWQEGHDGSLVNPKKQYPVRTKKPIKMIQLSRNAIYRIKYNVIQKKEWMPYSDYLMMTQKQLSHQGKMKYSLAKKLLGDLHVEVTKSGAEFFVFMLPYKTIVDPDAQKEFQATIPNFKELYDLERPAKEMEEFLKNSNIAYFDFVPAMKKYYVAQSNRPLFYYSDGHLTPKGHAFVARQLEPIISSLVHAR